MKAVIHGSNSFEVQETDVDVNSIHLDLAGTLPWKVRPSGQSIHGELQNIPMDPVLKGFFPTTSIITGTRTGRFQSLVSAVQGVGQRAEWALAVGCEKWSFEMLKTMYKSPPY